MSSIRLVTGNPALADTDLIIAPVFDGEAVTDSLPALDAATSGEARRATASGEFKGRLGDFFLMPAHGWKAARIALAGAGKHEEFDLERLRKVATASALAARARRIPRVAFLVRGPMSAADGVQAAVEGLKAYASVLEVPGPIDMASFYVPPEIGEQVIGEVAQKGIPEVWLNPGAESDELIARARALHIQPIVACSIVAIGENPYRL